MEIKIKMLNKVDEIKKHIEQKYDLYQENQKEYYNLQYRLTKGELVWQMLNGADTSDNYYQISNVSKLLENSRRIKDRIDVFQNQYLNTEDKQLYTKGLITADLDLLYKSYQKGNMDAAFIWGVVTLQNGNRRNEAIEVLKRLIDQKTSYSMDSMLTLAEYYEICGLTESKDLNEAQDHLKTSLKLYKELERKFNDAPSQYKGRLNNIESILECYKTKQKSDSIICRLQKRARIKERVGGLLFNIIAVPFAAVLALAVITTCKHAIEIEVGISDIDMIIKRSGNIICEDKYSVSFSDKLPYLRGDYIPALLPIGIDDNKFQSATYTVKNGISKVPVHITEYANNVSNIELPDSVVEISDYAFLRWSSLETINLPSSIQSIGREAFAKTNIRNFIWPENITEIPSHTFWECENLENIELPDTITSIGNGAFSHCTNLRSIDLPNSLTQIDEYAFWTSGLESIVIPENVSSIGSRAFEDCSELKTIELPDQLTAICDYMFDGCGKLEEIKLPSNLENINTYAFNECYSLTSITLPENIKFIDHWAFNNTGLKNITLPYGIESIGRGNFDGLEAIFVDSREYDRYKDYFSSFAEIRIKD